MSRRNRTPSEDSTQTETVAAVVPILPGAAEVDTVLIDQAVQEINLLYRRKGLETYLEIGQYIIDTFFVGEEGNFEHAEGHKSFRELEAKAKSKTLAVSYVSLWNAVAIRRQYDSLPEEVRDQLGFAHHRALLTVKDPEAKTQLAQEAASGLTEKQLRERVREQKPNTGAGRPELPAFVKGLNALRRAVASASKETITKDTFARYGHERARQLVSDVRADLARAEALIADIERSIEQM